ncbi:MAG: hypothetical protein KR126chlam6_01507 [Candidatus Anoxychlamydiales bacterium]|nr:hypothetical protein [Candidatus Anoxychlamydiales bacterium]
MPKKKITWIAETGKYPLEFSTKKEAVAVEKEYNFEEKIKKLSVILRKYFKTYYKDNRFQKYIYFCVDCGKKLLEYKCENDGHRNERGDVIFQENNIVTLFDGMRCKKCNKKTEKLFEKMLCFYFKKNKIVHIFSIENWKSFYYKDMNKTILLHILKIVDYYDKNFKKKEKL